MEWLPKLLDTFDSSVFSLRLAWAGYHGCAARNILKIGAVCSVAIVSPVILGVGVVAVATFILTELAYRFCVLTGFFGSARSPA